MIGQDRRAEVAGNLSLYVDRVALLDHVVHAVLLVQQDDSDDDSPEQHPMVVRGVEEGQHNIHCYPGRHVEKSQQDTNETCNTVLVLWDLELGLLY